jgi:hypothetical protein
MNDAPVVSALDLQREYRMGGAIVHAVRGVTTSRSSDHPAAANRRCSTCSAASIGQMPERFQSTARASTE